MTRVSFTICPFCGCEHELASAVSKRPAPPLEPRMLPGAVTMCVKCGELSVMGDNEMLRKPEPDEARELAGNVIVQKLREAWRESVGRKISS